jgi:uncharacterized protein (AIM24 family)
MAIFTVTGDVDPFLHVSLHKGEKIYCESDAMVMMEDTLDLTGKMTGGLGSALMRPILEASSTARGLEASLSLAGALSASLGREPQAAAHDLG